MDLLALLITIVLIVLLWPVIKGFALLILLILLVWLLFFRGNRQL